MSNIETVKSFADSMKYEEEKGAGLDLAKGRYPFVTISREAGAGGHTLAEALIEEMKKEKDPLFQGWQMFDQELCKKVCEEPGLKVTLNFLLSFEYRSQIEDMMAEMIVGNSPQDIIFKKIFQIIRNLAGYGKVILVGRGSSCLTRELPQGIHVRLVAPLPIRIKRIMKVKNFTEAKAKDFIHEQDKSRQRLVKTFFNCDIENPLLYDIVWNTARVPTEEIARLLLGMIKERAKTLELKIQPGPR
ncbi:MAG TPA: cytidylate kinase-like family protein [bacterium]|nr:cytidylate kinase-like family protein [bacterium]